MHILELQAGNDFFTNIPGLTNHSLQHSNHKAPEVIPPGLVDLLTPPKHKTHPSATPGQRVPKLHPVHRCMQARYWWHYHH